MLRKNLPLITACCLLGCASGLAYAADPLFEDDVFFADDLAIWGEHEQIYSATRYVKRLKEAPAIATVITAQQIKQMGASTLGDVLKNVPGLSIITTRAYGKLGLEIRGAKNSEGDMVSFNIDNHHVNSVTSGSAVWSFANYPTAHIKRIEFIRGPGSALYGANAAVAVVNIVTQAGAQINGSKATMARASHSGQRYNILTGSALGNWSYSAMLNYLEHDQTGIYIEQDLLGQSGTATNELERSDILLRAKNGNFSIDLYYTEEDKGDYIGGYDTLNDNSNINFKQQYAVLTYSKGLANDSHINLSAQYDQWNYIATYELLPAGAHPTYPNGMHGTLPADTRASLLEGQWDAFIGDQHTLTIGLSHEHKEKYNIRAWADFDPDNSFLPFPSGQLQNISNIGAFGRGAKRKISTAYVQDLIQATSNLELTLGLRYDHYNDLGGVTNPRAGLVWAYSPKTHYKLLYGSAFKAPNFQELYIDNNPAIIGNENLNPTWIKTLEASVNHQYTDAVEITTTLFSTRITDVINVVSGQFSNAGAQKMWGLELELRNNLSNNNYYYANYSYIRTRENLNNNRIEGIPHHKANAGINYRVTPLINANTSIRYMGERPRAETDNRDELKAYIVADTSILVHATKNIDIQLTAHNLTDKKHISTDPSAKVSKDYPHTGRSIELGVTLAF